MKRVIVMFVAMVCCGSFFVNNSVSAVTQGGGKAGAFEGVPFSEIIDSAEEASLRKTASMSIIFSLQQHDAMVQDLSATLGNIMILLERASELGEVKLFTLSEEGANNIKNQLGVLMPIAKTLKQALVFLKGGENLAKVLPLMEKATEELMGRVIPLREDLVKRILPAIEKEVEKITGRRKRK